MEYVKGNRVRHNVYGNGTVTKMTKRPVRVWVKWDDTGYTTPVNPESVELWGDQA